MNRVTIAIDAMGGDHGPSVTIPASLAALQKHSNLHLVLVGDQTQVQDELNKHPGYDSARLDIHHTTQRVAMDESPTQALRYKKDSSMRVAVNLVKEGNAQACVSAGNTGALMAIAHFVLKTINGVDRPAIISVLPSIGKDMRMLDLGANVDSSAMHLAQFAVMASVLASAVDNISNPKVYLLNIGEEVIKGNKQVKETAMLLSQTKAINYKGFIEGDAIFDGEADVVVCDGFVGNVALKTSEGAALFVSKLIKEGFSRNFLTKLVGLAARPILKSVIKRVDPGHYNGATFLGLQGIVVKSHGSAKITSFTRAIEQAIIQAEKNILHLISDEVEKSLKSTPFGTS
ncbi:MAG TPA: phosphate acyltransferase PlsX [Gammaproteobacteria bacterium]|nr:phosphate acyltransferase PlsX [Gammaproteobacteria bacterium]